MPSLADILVDEEAEAGEAAAPARRRAARLPHRAPPSHLPLACIISLFLHLALGLWLAEAVRSMLAAEAAAPVDCCLTLRSRPLAAYTAPPADPLPAASLATTAVIPATEAAPIPRHELEEGAPDGAEAPFASAFLEAPASASAAPLSHLPSPTAWTHVCLGRPQLRIPASGPLADDAPVAQPAAADATATDAGPPPAPRLLAAPDPVYPLEARRAGEQGTVELALTIAADGATADLAILASSGHASLDDAALEAVRRWRFAAGSAARRTSVRILFVMRDRP